MAQHPSRQLFARTVEAEVRFGPEQLGLATRDVDQRVGESLERVGLDSARKVHPHDLSPPEQKLVALASALAQGTGVIVLDEPTQGMDRSSRFRVAEIVRGCQHRGMSVLVVSHDAAFVAEACDRVLVLQGGQIGWDGTVSELMTDGDLLASLGLARPPAADLAHRLGLPGAVYRYQEVVSAVRRRHGVRSE